MGGVDVAGQAWSGAKMVFMPVLIMLAVWIGLKAIAWIVKAKRGY